MRLVVDSMIGLMLLGIFAGVLLFHRQESSQIDKTQSVHDSLARLHEAAVLHRVIESEGDARSDYLRHVSPGWFAGGELPVNLLLDRNRPWIDVAPPGDFAAHPPDPVADAVGQAGFWYNPNTGVFRARVPRQVTARDTLNLYNRINAAALAAVTPVNDPSRMPVALSTEDVSTALASPPPQRLTPSAQARVAAPEPIDVFDESEVITLDPAALANAPISLFDDDDDSEAQMPAAPESRPTLRRE